MTAAVLAFDAEILRFVQESIRFPALTAVMRFFSTIGDMGLVWILLGLVLVCIRRTRRGGIDMLCALTVEFVLCDLVIKRLAARARPYLSLEWLELLVHEEASFSFPSGHSASSFACAAALTCAFGKKGALAFIPAALIALSRIYVGVHYPSDVLIGAVLGSAAIAVLIDARLAAEGLPAFQGGAEGSGGGAMPSHVLDGFSRAMADSMLLPAAVLLGDETSIVFFVFILAFGTAGTVFCALQLRNAVPPRKTQAEGSFETGDRTVTVQGSAPESHPAAPELTVQLEKPARPGQACWDEDSGPNHRFPPNKL